MFCRSGLLTLLLVGFSAVAVADEIRYYVENGVTYRETRRLVQRPVAETQNQQTTRTTYREEWTTEQREVCQTTWAPVTEYRYETYWVGLLNPFIQPYLAARYVPYTRWQAKSQKATIPVRIRKVTPETQTAVVPVTTYRNVTEEIVDRVPMGALPGGPQYAAAPRAALRPLQPITPQHPTPTLATPTPAYGSNYDVGGAAAPPPSLSAPSGAPATSPAPAYSPPGGYAPPSTLSAPSATTPRTYTPIGGISRLEQDPPRQGAGWQPILR